MCVCVCVRACVCMCDNPPCRYLGVHYPHFPSEADFVHRIVSYGELEQHSEGGELRGLSEFAQGWRRLQAGGLLLPDLVEFYRWLHTELCTYVTSGVLYSLQCVYIANRK